MTFTRFTDFNQMVNSKFPEGILLLKKSYSKNKNKNSLLVLWSSHLQALDCAFELWTNYYTKKLSKTKKRKPVYRKKLKCFPLSCNIIKQKERRKIINDGPKPLGVSRDMIRDENWTG